MKAAEGWRRCRWSRPVLASAVRRTLDLPNRNLDLRKVSGVDFRIGPGVAGSKEDPTAARDDILDIARSLVRSGEGLVLVPDTLQTAHSILKHRVAHDFLYEIGNDTRGLPIGWQE